MRRFLASLILFLICITLPAAIDSNGNEYKTTIVEFSLLDTDYANVTIGFRDVNDEAIKSIELNSSDLHAESDTFKVFWEIVSSTSFNLYLKGNGPLLNNDAELDWQVESVSELGGSGAIYFSGINKSDNTVYSTGGLFHNHKGEDFRDSGEQLIKIVTDNFVDQASGKFRSAQLKIEIVSA